MLSFVLPLRAAILGTLFILGSACNAILGIEESVDRPADDGGSSGGAAQDGSAGAIASGGFGQSGGFGATGGFAASSGGGGLGGSGGSSGSADAGEDASFVDASTPDADPCGGSCAPPTICENEKCCNPGMPVTTTDATPSGTCGVTCDVSFAGAQDDKGARLDCSGSGYVLLDGQSATSCVQADFGTIYNPTDIVVRARLVNKACTKECGVSSGGTDGCAAGSSVRVYRADDPSTPLYVGKITASSSWSDTVFALGAPTRYVIVCRAGYGSYVRDVEVDVIRSTTCP